jgi:hypothetical protein
VRKATTVRYLLLVAVLAVGGALAGFVYEHEPERDRVSVSIDRGGEAPDGPLDGTIAGVEGGRFALQTDAGLVDLELGAGAVLEELARIDPGEIEAGAAVNVGGVRAETGPALTGIVVVEPSP